MQSRVLTIIVFVLAIIATASITMLATKSEAPASAGSEAAGSPASGGAVSKAELEKAIADYIQNNPETVINALMAGRAKQEAKAAEEATKTIATKRDELEKDPQTPVFGNPNGDVTVVMFSDYNCGYCKRATPQIDALIKADPKVKVVIKEFPILGDASVMLAKAGIAFYKLNPSKFYEFHEAIMKSTPRSPEQLANVAEQFGVKGADLTAQMENAETQKEIEENIQLGTSIGVRGTPAFIIGGEFIRGAADTATMKANVEKARKAS